MVAGAGELAGLGASVKGWEAGLASAERGLAGLDARLRELDAAMAQHGTALAAALREEAGARDRHRETTARIAEETLAAVREHNAKLRQELGQERDLVHRVETGLVRLVDELTERVTGGPGPRANGGIGATGPVV